VVEISNLTGLRDLSGLNHYLVHGYQIFQISYQKGPT